MFRQVRILYINIESEIRNEIIDYSHSASAEAVFAGGFREAVYHLDRMSFNRVVLRLTHLADAAILKYINNYFGDIEVVVTTTRENEEVLEVLNKSKFSVIGYPFHLRDLGITENTK